MSDTIKELRTIGQSLWLDNIRRQLVTSAEVKRAQATAPKLEPSKPKPRKPKPPRFNAKPNKSGTSEKSSPPNEVSLLKEVAPSSNWRAPPNREPPK